MKYEVIVKTGNVMFAGTDAHVYIILEGDNRKTDKLILGDHHDNFERGMIETFMVLSFGLQIIIYRLLSLGSVPSFHCFALLPKYLF